MSKPFTYTTECPSCDGKGGWTDYGRGWGCYSGPEPDEWVPCERCDGTGKLTHECDEPDEPLTPNPPTRALKPVLEPDDDFDDSDPFGDEP